MGFCAGSPLGCAVFFLRSPLLPLFFLRFCLCAPFSAHLGTGAALPERCLAPSLAPTSLSALCSRLRLASVWSNLTKELTFEWNLLRSMGVSECDSMNTPFFSTSITILIY